MGHDGIPMDDNQDVLPYEQDVHLQNGCILTTPAPNHIEDQGVPW
jgi:hypothetical protein